MSKNLAIIENISNNTDASTISVGQISFINCLPINYTFKTWSPERIILSEGYPSMLNSLVKEGRLNITPVSSIEYLNNQDKLSLIDSLCIGSYGEVASVILFCKSNIEDLSGKKIGIPHTSATSIALLKVIFNKLNIKNPIFKQHRYESNLEKSLSSDFDAILYIGDPALNANYKYNDIIKYDLGQLWKDLTGLPMVFATWVAESNWKDSHVGDFEWVSFLLDKAVDTGLTMYFNNVLEDAHQRTRLDMDILRRYYTQNIKYEFTDAHRESLRLFKKLYDRILRQEYINEI